MAQWTVEFANQIYPDHQIGRWTYGIPEVLSWGEGTTPVIGAFCSVAPGMKICLGGEHGIDWLRPTRSTPYGKRQSISKDIQDREVM